MVNGDRGVFPRRTEGLTSRSRVTDSRVRDGTSG